jgi:membrane-bound lytic murein transglycosylase B
LGKKARAALRDWQKKHALPADGFATDDLLTRVAIDASSRPK